MVTYRHSHFHDKMPDRRRMTMYRSLLALLATAPLLAAPGLKETDGPPYFPIQVGAKRVLESSTTGGLPREPVEWTETVTDVEVKDGKHLVTVVREQPTALGGTVRDNGTVYEVSGKGLVRVTKDVNDPGVLLKTPARPGDTWTRAGYTFTVGKEEEVKVPAGKYKAIPIAIERDLTGPEVKWTEWFAPEVGMVKSVKSGFGTEETIVLKSFTPGK